MNLSLLRDAVGLTYPEEFADVLDYSSGSSAVCCQFNRYGTLLAAGYNDGCVVIWDFLTKGVVKVLAREAPITIICCVSWSRSGHYLLTASTDNNVCIWHVLTGHCQHVYKFPCPVLRAQYHPRQAQQFLITLLKHGPVVMCTDGTITELPIETGSDHNFVASYDHRGEHIYVANGKGRVWVVTTGSFTIIASFKATQATGNSAAVKSLDFPHRQEYFVTNSGDRILRIYNTAEVIACGKNGEPETEGKLQDMVNKTLWKKCCFSGDGKYLCAGSTRQHALFIFDRVTGAMVKILHGTKGEILLDVTWHPVLPVIASVANGVISLCTPKQKENWSAFAPDFKEIEENIEYEEVEGEFDIYDEDRSPEGAGGSGDEDAELDVTRCEPVVEFVSSDEEGEVEVEGAVLQSLPVSPDPEDGVVAGAGVTSVGDDMATDSHTPLTINTAGVTAPAGKGSMISPTPAACISPVGAVTSTVPQLPAAPVIPVILSNVSGADDIHPLLGSSRRSDKTAQGKRSAAVGGSGPSACVSPATLTSPLPSTKPTAPATDHLTNANLHTAAGKPAAAATSTVGSRRASAAASKKDKPAAAAATGKPPAVKKPKRSKEPKWK